MITSFSLFEKFVHGTPYKTTEKIIDIKEYIHNSIKNIEAPTEKELKDLTMFLKENKYNLAKMYHGTHPKIDILNQGLLTTKVKTKKSMQSEPGYVYMTYYPSYAKMFGDLAYGINNATIYELHVPIELLKPDKDQLYNMKCAYPELNIGDTLAESLVYGHGARVKGDIPPYMISVYKINN